MKRTVFLVERICLVDGYESTSKVATTYIAAVNIFKAFVADTLVFNAIWDIHTDNEVPTGENMLLYGGGKQIHFKKERNFSTISGKSNSNGVRFNRGTFSIEWTGLKIECDISRDIDYIRESLGNNKVKYCELKRLMFLNGWHYYVIIYLDGDAPRKYIESKKSCMGIDPGIRTGCKVLGHQTHS